MRHQKRVVSSFLKYLSYNIHYLFISRGRSLFAQCATTGNKTAPRVCFVTKNKKPAVMWHKHRISIINSWFKTINEWGQPKMSHDFGVGVGKKKKSWQEMTSTLRVTPFHCYWLWTEEFIAQRCPIHVECMYFYCNYFIIIFHFHYLLLSVSTWLSWAPSSDEALLRLTPITQSAGIDQW